MNHPGTTIFVPLSADLEIKVTLQAREFNGIASDPKTIVRDCSISEAITATKLLGKADEVWIVPTLDYPEQDAPDLADEIATYLLTPGGLPECERVQLMKKQPDGSERDCGGWCKEALADAIRQHLP